MATKKQITSIEWVKNTVNLWRVFNSADAKKLNPYKKLTAISKAADRRFHAWELAKEQFNVSDAELVAKGFIKPARIHVLINPDYDFFAEAIPQAWRNEFFEFVETTPHIDYILVTKRIGNAKRMLPQSWLDNGYPANVWQLITACNQSEADRDIPKLLELDCAVRHEFSKVKTLTRLLLLTQ